MLAACLICGCAGTTTKLRSTAEDQYREAMSDYQKKRYLRAVDGFQKLIYNFGGAPMVDSAQYYLAMSHFEQDDYFTAASEFERLIATYPGSPFVDESHYMMGLCLYKATPSHYGLDQEELLRAIAVLTDFETDYPESPSAVDARATIKLAQGRLAKKRYETGRQYFRLGQYPSAGIYFQKVIDEYTDSEWAARAYYYQGESDYKQNKLQDARVKFSNFLVVYPTNKLAGKAQRMLDRIDKDLAESAQKN
jgi:outer membrane protein assembly factor BamD